MGAPTGVLRVDTPQKTETFEWNGIPAERAAAKQEFEKRMGSGHFLAAIVEGPGRRRQVREFSEIEDHEKEKGTVEVRMTPAVVGG